MPDDQLANDLRTLNHQLSNLALLINMCMDSPERLARFLPDLRTMLANTRAMIDGILGDDDGPNPR